MQPLPSPHWQRRARPWLGTLVEVGIGRGTDECAVQAAFAAIADVQACLSRFEPGSDIARFHALAAGGRIAVSEHTAAVLAVAQSLRDASDGLFDVSLGTGMHDWQCDGDVLHKAGSAVRLDLGGIAKGYAVDQAVEALQANGCRAGWVNAGGDLRAFGDVELPLALRDERGGGVRPFATLADGAFATSHLGAGSRSQAHWRARDQAAGAHAHAHASVAAPLCLWADALTKIVAVSGDAHHPLLARHGAAAWLH